MKTKVFAIVAIVEGLIGLGCEGNNEPQNHQLTNQLNTQLAALSAPLSEQSALLMDAPALETASAIRAAFQRGTQKDISFAVYDLADVPRGGAGTVAARAAALGLAGAEDPGIDNNRLGFTSGTRRLTRNQHSGAEFFADTARFHRGAGVARERLFADGDYINAARGYVNRSFGAEAAQAALFPYKVRKYLNASAAAGGSPQGETVYQIAVAFNSTVDGIPVIGPGSKVVVHMTPDGEVVGHEASLRAIKGRRATVAGSDLVAPDEAKAVVEARMKSRGIDLRNYNLTREEFGYLRRGRNSVQRVLVPHYAYIYEPASKDVMGKKVVELVPAVRDRALLVAVHADEAAEHSRKAEAMRGVGAPNVK